MKKYIIIAFIAIVSILGFIFVKNNKDSIESKDQKANIANNIITASGSQDFNISVVLPLSGNMQKYGQEIKEVLMMASDEINSSTMFSGNLKLQFIDGGCDRDLASKNIREQINPDKINAIMGGICQEETEAINSFSLSDKVIYLNIGQTASDYVKNNVLSINFYPSLESQIQMLSDLAFKKKNKKIAILKDRSIYGDRIANIFEADFEYKGGEVFIDSVDINIASSQAILDKINNFKKSGSSSLFLALSDVNYTREILNSMRKVRWFAPLYLSNNLSQSIADFGSKSNDLDSAISMNFDLSANNDNFNLFNQRYFAKYKNDIVYKDNAIIAYDAIYFIIDANEAVGVRNDALLDWMSSIKDWIGISGPVVIGQDGYRLGSYSPFIVTNGRLEAIK